MTVFKNVFLAKNFLMLAIGLSGLTSLVYAQTPAAPSEPVVSRHSDVEVPGFGNLSIPDMQPNPNAPAVCVPYRSNFDSDHRSTVQQIEDEAIRLTEARLDSFTGVPGHADQPGRFAVLPPVVPINQRAGSIAAIGGYIYQQSISDRLQSYHDLFFGCDRAAFAQLFPRVSSPVAGGAGPRNYAEALVARNAAHDALKSIIWLSHATELSRRASERGMNEVLGVISQGFPASSPFHDAASRLIETVRHDLGGNTDRLQRSVAAQRELVALMTRELTSLDSILPSPSYGDCPSEDGPMGMGADDAGVASGDAGVPSSDVACADPTISASQAQSVREHTLALFNAYQAFLEGRSQEAEEQAPAPVPLPTPAASPPAVAPTLGPSQSVVIIRQPLRPTTPATPARRSAPARGGSRR